MQQGGKDRGGLDLGEGRILEELRMLKGGLFQGQARLHRGGFHKKSGQTKKKDEYSKEDKAGNSGRRQWPWGTSGS